MAFTKDEYHISWCCLLYSVKNCLPPVREYFIGSITILHSLFNILDNRQGFFRTGIIRGQDNHITTFCSNPPRLWPFPCVPLPTTAKYYYNLAFGQFMGCLQYIFHSIRCMGIIHNNCKILSLVYQFKSAGNPCYLFQPILYFLRAYPQSITAGNGCQGIIDIK